MRSRLTVFVANVAPQSLFIDDYLINVKYAEDVLHLCSAEVNNTGIARASICNFKNEHILDCCKNLCPKFAHASNLVLNSMHNTATDYRWARLGNAASYKTNTHDNSVL